MAAYSRIALAITTISIQDSRAMLRLNTFCSTGIMVLLSFALRMRIPLGLPGMLTVAHMKRVPGLPRFVSARSRDLTTVP